MNRALATFLAFCAALLILFSAIAWWLGAPLLNLAFDAERRQSPYHVIYMANTGVGAASEPTAESYGRRFEQLLEAESAARLWVANSVSVPAGEVADEWQQVLAVGFSSGSEFVRLVTGGDYRQLRQAAPGGRRSAFGLSQGPLLRVPPPELLLIAAALPEGSGSNLSATFLPALTAGGQMVWDSPMVVLEGDAQFNHLLMLGFEDAQRIDEWLSSAATETDLALLRSQVGSLTLWRLGALSR
ncbi:MAG: hypothetical protein ACR2PZ_25880 [Pseudomonadales bacterium]